MQIPILEGIYVDDEAAMRTSPPRNLIPYSFNTGLSNGYLGPCDGIEQFGVGPGQDRGGINWDGIHYRVMGEELVRINNDGSYTSLGNVGLGGKVTFDYSFDYLAVSSGGRFYLFDGTTITQVTDPDLGNVVDFVWVDGYFMTTDGSFIAVTELNDPFSVNPFKYGSSEADPDPIIALQKIRNEVYAVNRYTIEVFDNVGGQTFPFSRIEGSQIEKGAVGTYACCLYLEQVAFVGSGFNETIGVYMAINGIAKKVSTAYVDNLLSELSDEQLSEIVCEPYTDEASFELWVHLPDQTLVFNYDKSVDTNTEVWYSRDSGLSTKSQFRAKNMVFINGNWIGGDPISNSLGNLVGNTSTQYGDPISWEFGTQIIYNNSKGAIFHKLELVGFPGRNFIGEDPTIWTQYSLNGETWSMEMPINAGKIGDRQKRLAWFKNGFMKNYRLQRFRGTSESHLSIGRLEADLEALYV